MPSSDLYGEAGSLLMGSVDANLKRSQQELEGQKLEEERRQSNMRTATAVGDTLLREAGANKRATLDREAQFVTITPQIAHGFSKNTGDEGWMQQVGQKMRADVLMGIYTHQLGTKNQIDIQKEISNRPHYLEVGIKGPGGKDLKQTIAVRWDPETRKFVQEPLGEATSQFDPARMEAARQREQGTSRKEFTAFTKDIERDLNAQRSNVGAARKSNRVINVALDRLSRPTTYQDLNALALDLNQAITGQMATKYGKETLEYKTIASKLANLQTYLTGKPKEVATPGVVEKFRRDLRGVMQVNNDLITQYLDEKEASGAEIIPAHQNSWNTFKNKILEGIEESQGSDAGAENQGQVKRRTREGKIAVFDANTKQFIRYEDQ